MTVTHRPGASVAAIALAVSLMVHTMLAVTPMVLKRPRRTPSRMIHFKVLKPKPRIATPALAPKPKPPPKARPPRRPKPKPLAVVRPRSHPEPSQIPPSVAPVFGATKRSVTTGDSSFGVPVGNTVATDPAKKGKLNPGESAPSKAVAVKPRPAPVRVRVKPKLRSEVKVPYPPKARSLGIEGTVKVRLLVGKKGTVKQAQVVSGPGFGLNGAARRALLQFHFHPAVGTDGKPIPCWIIYRYTFQIDD